MSLRPRYLSPRPLAALIEEFGLEEVTEQSISDVELSGIAISSHAVVPGDLYVGVQGAKQHGAHYASDAAQRGAVAVLTDATGVSIAQESGLPIVVTENPRAALGTVAAWLYRTGIYRDPDIHENIYAVTGTNGKTSVVYLLYGLLQQLGRTAGLSSTAERRIGDEAVVSTLTTPEASELHSLLARMRESEVRNIAIEVSAQALSRHRVDGLVFDVAGFTNLSHDHLDDYGDFETYFAAKRELFTPERSRRGVIVTDTEWGVRMVEEARIPVTTLSSHDPSADWHVEVTEESIEQTSFRLTGHEFSIETHVPMLGAFSASNAALALVMLVSSGFSAEQIREVLVRDGGIRAFVPGRAERISGPTGPAVFIDYAHTPDAFEQLLTAVRKVTPGKVIMVFGADGDRDPSKRAAMGAIAARGSDVVVITDFHPRFEDPAAIRATLISGARAAVPSIPLHDIAQPREAFRYALSIAGDDDVIVYAGPGHEDYHEVAGQKIPYSARNDARAALREAGWDA